MRKYSHADVLLPLMQIFISSTKIDVATFSSFMLLQEISIYTTQGELYSSSLLVFHTIFIFIFLSPALATEEQQLLAPFLLPQKSVVISHFIHAPGQYPMDGPVTITISYLL